MSHLAIASTTKLIVEQFPNKEVEGKPKGHPTTKMIVETPPTQGMCENYCWGGALKGPPLSGL
eukprot:15941335-Heterocapsa_arctica.AAC.1